MQQYIEKIRRCLSVLYPSSLNKIIIPCILLLYIDNILSYFIGSSIINNSFEPVNTTLFILEFMIGLLNIVAFTSWYIQLELILKNGLCPAHKCISSWYIPSSISDSLFDWYI